MRKIIGLEQSSDTISKDRLVDFFLDDFKMATFLVYAINPVGEKKLLADLQVMDEGISYNPFEKKIDLFFQGRTISRGSPTRYCIQGNKLLITGRCSVSMNVCGADLLLNSSSYENPAQLIRQKYTIDLKKLLKFLSI